MPRPAPPRPARPSPRRPRSAPRGAPDPAAPSWEDRLLAGADRFLGATLAPPPGGPGGAGRGGLRGRLFSGSWKSASAVEVVGGAVILLVVVLARPGADDAALAAPAALDQFEAEAAGVSADGAVVLASGARVHLLGVTLPTAEDPPAVRAAAFGMLDQLVRGRRVQVAFDPVLPSALQQGQPVSVAYVWVLGADGRRRAMANSVLLARGLGRPVTTLGYAHQGLFLEATYVAQGQGAGLWRPEDPAPGLGPAALGHVP